MKIRLLQEKDIIEAAHIVRINYSKKYEKSATDELKDMFGASAIKPKYYVAEEKGKIIGFAGFIQSWMDYSIYQIFWVNVIPKEQKKGTGRALVYKIITEIKKYKKAYLILLTADADVKNNQYYKKNFGFKTLELFDKKSYHLMGLSLE